MKENFEFSKYISFKHVFKFSSLNYLQSALSFIASIFLARHLGTNGYGQYAYGLIFANTLMVIMQFGTDKTLVRDLIQIDFPERTLTAAALLWSTIGIIGTIGIAIWAFFISDMDNAAACVVLLCTLSGVAQGMTVSGWFDLKGKMNLDSLFVIIGRVFFLVGILALIFFVKNSTAVIWSAGILLFSRVITLYLEWSFVKQTAQIFIKEALLRLKYIVKVNVWVWWAAIGNLLMTQANQIILKDFGGKTQLAYYAISFQIIMLVRMLQSQIMRVVAPSIANITHLENMDAKMVSSNLLKYSLASFVASIILLLPLYLLTPWIVHHFLGDNYLPAIPVMNVLYVWSALFGVALINNQFLIGLRKERLFFGITLIFGIMSLILAFFFVKRYEAMGAAMSLLFAHTGSILCQIWVVFRAIKKLKK